MRTRLLLLATAVLSAAVAAHGQSTDSCAALTNLKLKWRGDHEGRHRPGGDYRTVIPWRSQPRTITSALSRRWCHPSAQGGGRRGVRNRICARSARPGRLERRLYDVGWRRRQRGGQLPLGASYSGEKPALVRGFAVASTDSGHKAKTGPLDFSFMRDQRAYLDFAYLANAEVAGVAKQIIARYYARPAAYSYFVGCSTGGREGMILSQRYPTAFNGIVVGDPPCAPGFPISPSPSGFLWPTTKPPQGCFRPAAD